MLGTQSRGACLSILLVAVGCGGQKSSTAGTGGESSMGTGAGSGSTGAGASTGTGAGGSTGTTSSNGSGGAATSSSGATTSGSSSGATTSSSGATTSSSGSSSSSSGSAPTASGCPVFLPTSPWNEDISAAPTTTMYNLPSANLHPDFDNDAADGIPYQYVTSAVTKSKVSFTYASESDTGPYPIPANPLIEGGGAGSGDAHMLMVETDTCVLYELYSVSQTGGAWSALSGAIWNLKINATRPTCWTSADAAGLPIFAGLARYEEVAAGAINHALRFTMSKVQSGFVAPASHLVMPPGTTKNPITTDPSDPPFGLRVRLKASVDISGATPQAKIILTAMKKYGLILADIGSNWYITGASSPSWNFDNDVTYLEKFTGSQFEVIAPGPVTTSCP